MQSSDRWHTRLFLALQEVQDDDDITSSDEAPDLDDDGASGALNASISLTRLSADVHNMAAG